MIPLYGFLEGDTVGLLVLADETTTVEDFAARLQQSARVRVRRLEAVRVMYSGRELDPKLTLQQAKIGALERIDVVRR
jgi:hypothetical protein